MMDQTQGPAANLSFDNELSWCIQKMSAMLSSEKQEKKARELSKKLSALKDPSGLLIRKRQIMFATFGDYRAKMAKESSSSSAASTTTKKVAPRLRFIDNSAKTLPASSKFVHKRTNTSTVNATQLDENSNLTGGFRFNFDISLTNE